MVKKQFEDFEKVLVEVDIRKLGLLKVHFKSKAVQLDHLKVINFHLEPP
jgi:hypothetical protein